MDRGAGTVKVPLQAMRFGKDVRPIDHKSIRNTIIVLRIAIAANIFRCQNLAVLRSVKIKSSVLKGEN